MDDDYPQSKPPCEECRAPYGFPHRDGCAGQFWEDMVGGPRRSRQEAEYPGLPADDELESGFARLAALADERRKDPVARRAAEESVSAALEELASQDGQRCPHGYERGEHHWFGCMGVDPFDA